MADVISVAQLEKASLDADTAGEFVSSPSLTTPDQGTPANPDIRTISGINAAGDAALGALGGSPIGEYSTNPLITERNQYVSFGVSPAATQWKITNSTSLDYQIDSATYPDPEDDPSLILFNDVTREYVNSNADLHDTLSRAKSRTDLKDNPSNPMIVIISDRADGRFQVVSGETPNTFNIIQHDTLPLQFKFIPIAIINIKMLGASGDGIQDTKSIHEIAATLSNFLIFPDDNGEVYDYSSAPTIGNSTSLISRASAVTGVTLREGGFHQVNAGVLPDLSGYLTSPELQSSRIEVVAGTLRQNAGDRTKWDWIKDSNHEPIGVDDSVPATASGSELNFNYLKTYSRVLSLVAGPDEDFANALSMSVGASVGLGNSVLKASVNQVLSAHLRWNGSSISIIYGSGQGGTGDFNVNISSAAYSGGNLTVDHESIGGTDLNLTGHTNGGAVVPYLPVIKSQSNTQTVLNLVDLSTGNLFTGSADTKISLQLNKTFTGGALMDGTGGSEVYDFDKGNIWFFGIFEV